MAGFRLPGGGRIDRSRLLHFTFEGRTYTGHPGDTLASGLLAAGVEIVGRSFKYHRPRGLLAAGPEEPNALMRIGTGREAEPNQKATEVELTDGLVAASQNCWPGVDRDLGAAAGLVARLLPAGFYYKTFMWPHWHAFEGLVRRAAGLGRAPTAPDPGRYETCHAHCDLLVVGGGCAGLAAAAAAAADGIDVMLVDERPALGGALRGAFPDDAMLDALLGNITAANVRCLTRTTAIGYHDHNMLTLVERLPGSAGRPRQRLWLVRAERVVLATGAIERPLLFPGNDRPGIMLAGATRHYLNEYAVAPGRRAVVVTNDDSAYDTAFALAEAGIAVAAVLDTRAEAPSTPAARLAALGIPLLAGSEVTATIGRRQVTGIVAGGRRIDCDCVAMSGGWTPTVHLFSQSGGRLHHDAVSGRFLPGVSAQAERSAGAARGVVGAAACRVDGIAAVRGSQEALPPLTAAPPWRPGQADAGRVWVDLQNDVTAADLELALRENYRSVEHVKRYTTLGMAVDQGKTSNVNGIAVLAATAGRPMGEIGTTRFRPPYTPVTLGVFAGRDRGDFFRPRRLLPSHDAQVALGATIEEYGGWQRPAWYCRPTETPGQATRREIAAVREAAGVFDGSPLGKIEVSGPDAAVFLDRIYANAMASLAVGRVRYGLMLNENGIVIDDGVVARLAPDHFLLSTTSGGADRIAGWLEEWQQCEWPDLRVVIAPVTTAWATIAVTGPRARDVLRAAGLAADLDLPHMSWTAGSLGELPARVARVSFTGELGFEVSVPWLHGQALFQRVLAAGATPVGIEAWLALRLEKGFIHVGVDTDGTTTADDLGWGPTLARKTGDFVGRRSLQRPDNRRPDRLQLVGVEPAGDGDLIIGAHVVAGGRSQGFVTSALASPTIGRWVGLALVAGGASRIGEVLEADDLGRRIAVRLVEPRFYDPTGDRLRG